MRNHVSLRRAAAILTFLLLAASAVAQSIPRPQGFVNDFAGVISSSDEEAMRGIAEEVQQKTGAEIAVVTVDTYSPFGSIEQFGIALAEEWGVGGADDSGVILMVAISERDLRMEVGFGLEGAIPDGRAGAVLDDFVVPDLRNNNYGAGLTNGVAAVAAIIADEYGVTLTGAGPQPVQRSEDSFDVGNLIYFIFVIIFFGGRWFFWPLLFAGRRRGFFGGGFGSSGGRSSFGGRGRGGGGFGGFSGGSFGGGGASRGF